MFNIVSVVFIIAIILTNLFFVFRLESTVITEDNMARIRDSIATLTATLQHVEKVSGDVSSITGDSHTKDDIRSLIQSMSRLVSEW